MKTVIIGGVAGGATAAARLRRLDEKREIVMLERGAFVSFANCGLPYYIGGVIEREGDLLLQTPQSFQSRFCVDVRVFSEVTAIDRKAKTVAVRDLASGREYIEGYDTLLLAPGAEPVLPKVPGIESGRVYTVRSIPDTERIKAAVAESGAKSALVIGGGYIGVEMAENLHRAGLTVTIAELADHVIAPLDTDMAREAEAYIRAAGVTLLLNNGVTGITETNRGLTVQLTDGSVDCDIAILAVGVRPDSSLASSCGLAVNDRGCIVTDSRMRTSDENIYAAGDAVEVTHFVTGKKAFLPLAGPANKQGRIAADNICGIPSKFHGTQGSSILQCFGATVAATGINEREAKALGLDYEKSFTLTGSHASYYPGGAPISIKLLFERKTGKLLGAQLVGTDGVDKRCDVLAAVLRMGGNAHDLTELELCYAPPYSSAKDPVNIAGYAAENILSGRVRVHHWHDIAAIDRDKNTLLDVRTSAEFARGHIEGAVHIPLDELRQRLAELDKDKPVYVNCQSGLRSYLACRILSQNGFRCSNLSGGYRLYRVVTGK